MLPSEALYPYTAKEARERGELELWRANFRTNCACAGAIELAIRKGFDGMHLGADCAKALSISMATSGWALCWPTPCRSSPMTDATTRPIRSGAGPSSSPKMEGTGIPSS